MASADLYTPTKTFLVGDSGDVFATVNAEQPGTMVAGSVVLTRANRGEETRAGNALPTMVEVIRALSPTSRQVGMSVRERDVVFDLDICIRLKDASGANQRDALEKIARALVNRYSGMTDLAINVTAPAKFRRSSAEVTSIDDEPDSLEYARSTVRATFTFTEPQADNT